jgi:hypothetical protein
MYHCQECGMAVIVIDGEEPIKACDCDAPIVAELAATCEGRGGIV